MAREKPARPPGAGANAVTRSTPAPAPTRAAALWASVRDSLWFVPGLMTLAGAVLALGLVAFDEWLLVAHRAPDPAFAGGVDGAGGVLGAIAATTIAVVGLVFSITVVALQLASSQFTPRVLRLFLRDPFVKQILGVFIGSFTYTLLVLRSVRGADEE